MPHTYDTPFKYQTNLVYDTESGVYRPQFDTDVERGRVSTVNSSTGALAAGASWTGQWEDVSNYPSVIFAAKTDQDGKAYMQFSPDASNVDSSLSYDVASGVNEVHRLSTTRQFYRAVFTNDSQVDQSYFRLQSIYGGQPELAATRNSVIQRDADALIVRPTDFNLESSQGLVEGTVNWQKFGYNESLDENIEETIWATGARWTPLTETGSYLTVRSNSDVDSQFNSGAIGLYLRGCGSGFLYQEEYLQLSGTTGVVTEKTWVGINRVTITGAGGYKRNFGAIEGLDYLGNDQFFIPDGEGVTQQCIFTVPSGRYAYGKKILFNTTKLAGGQAPRVDLRVWLHDNDANVSREVLKLKTDTAVDNVVFFDESAYFVIPPKTFIELTAESSIAAAFAGARFWLTEIEID